MSAIPFPPPPEFGWYDDDTVASDDADPVELGQDPASSAAERPLEALDEPDDDGPEDWDATVLSSSFSVKPHKRYRLHDDATGQTIELDRSVLLGRNVTTDLPPDTISVELTDPTRTVSRNHCAIAFDQDGTLWIEDYGSLNGTFIIDHDEERQVVKGEPVRLTVPTVLRIGDQFLSLDER